jgi:hypothetical protein
LLTPFFSDVLGKIIVALRAGDVWLRGEIAMLPALFFGRWYRFEFLLNLHLSGRASRCKSLDRGLRESERSQAEMNDDEQSEGAKVTSSGKHGVLWARNYNSG